MESSFHSDENKGVIWQLLSDYGAFKDISEKHFYNVVDEWRPEHLWMKNGNDWILKNPIS